jgi:cytochrome c-type biogenesis protein CcmH
MSRWLLPAALGAAAAAVVLVALGALGPGTEATVGERADALARELRCPDCQALSVADSETSAAVEIRRRIDELLASGASDAEVRAHFVERYGDWILLAPSVPLAWLVPLAVVVAAAVGLLAWLTRRTRRSAAPAPLSTDERQRLHEEAEALDA